MPNQTPDISIVVPCYNEEASLPLFLNELAQVVRSMRAAKPLEFEVVLVDDGSSDSTLAIMKEQTNVCCNDYCIKWVSFSRNFGKEAALYAGLEHATGNLVATMDADMQDPPSLLPEMYRILQDEDCDNVATRRTTREGEPPIRSWFARMFYRIINKISKADIVDGARDFRLMKRPDGRRHPVHAGIQPLLQGHLRLGRLQDCLAPLRQRQPGCRRNQMEFLLTFAVLNRWDRRILHCAAVHRLGHGHALLHRRLFRLDFHYRSGSALW